WVRTGSDSRLSGRSGRGRMRSRPRGSLTHKDRSNLLIGQQLSAASRRSSGAGAATIKGGLSLRTCRRAGRLPRLDSAALTCPLLFLLFLLQFRQHLGDGPQVVLDGPAERLDPCV